MQAQLVDSLSDKEAEQAVLGAMMTDKSVIPQVITKLGQTSDVFFHCRPSAYLFSYPCCI